MATATTMTAGSAGSVVLPSEKVSQNQRAKLGNLTPAEEMAREINTIYGHILDACDQVPPEHGQRFDKEWAEQVEMKEQQGDREAALRAARQLSSRFRPVGSVATARIVLKKLVDPYEQLEQVVAESWLTQVEPAMEQGQYQTAMSAAWKLVEDYSSHVAQRDYDEAKRLFGRLSDSFFSAVANELQPELDHAVECRKVAVECAEIAREAEDEALQREAMKASRKAYQEVTRSCRYVSRASNRAVEAPGAQKHLQSKAREAAEARRRQYDANRLDRANKNRERADKTGSGNGRKGK